VVVYGLLRVCARGISGGNSEVGKNSNCLGFSQIQQFFLYGVLGSVFFITYYNNNSPNKIPTITEPIATIVFCFLSFETRLFTFSGSYSTSLDIIFSDFTDLYL
jgi:hypothetical protein